MGKLDKVILILGIVVAASLIYTAAVATVTWLTTKDAVVVVTPIKEEVVIEDEAAEIQRVLEESDKMNLKWESAK